MKQLHPKAVWFFFFSHLLGWTFLFLLFMITALPLFMSAGTIKPGIGGFLAIPAVLFIIFMGLMYFWSKLTYKYYKYELREDGFRKELGVISKKYVTIPYERIQNVDIYRSLLARILGLSDLNIQTAGASAQVTRGGVLGAGAEGRLPALSPEDAEQLRDELIRRMRQSGTQGL